MKPAILLASLALLLGLAVAGPAHSQASKKSTFTVAVKTKTAKGWRYNTVGRVVRDGNGRVTATAVSSPTLDRMANRLVARWKRHKRPASVKVSEELYSDTGMRPSKKNYSFDFKSTDPLYPAAVVKHFTDKHGYKSISVEATRFIVHDTEASKHRGHVDDESLAHYNFRKGTEAGYHNGKWTFTISAQLRPANNGKPTGVLRTSKSNPRLAVAQNHDDGRYDIGVIEFHSDGRTTIRPIYSKQAFESHFDAFKRIDDMTVDLITDATTWSKVRVGKNSAKFLEAFLVGLTEQGVFYRVTPNIDPSLFR